MSERAYSSNALSAAVYASVYTVFTLSQASPVPRKPSAEVPREP